MGRRILTAAAVATTALGVVAVPAFANSAGHTYSNGTKLTHKQKSLVATRMHAIQTTALTTGQAHVINHGTFSECTVPEGNHTYANFYSTDTVHYLETDTATANRGLLIGTCTADLTKKQTSASSTDKPGGKMIIPTRAGSRRTPRRATSSTRARTSSETPRASCTRAANSTRRASSPSPSAEATTVMKGDTMDERSENVDRTEEAAYEAPTVVDHGSLAELTLASSGSLTDGAGFGGGS